MAANIFSSPPQFGQRSKSISNTGFKSRAQDIFAVLEGAHGLVEESPACLQATSACSDTGRGTMAERNFAALHRQLCQHTVKANQMKSRTRNQRFKALHELQVDA